MEIENVTEIKRFPYKDKKKKPPFEYVILTSIDGDLSYLDYYLFNNFDKAYNQLKVELSKGNDLAGLYTIDFNTIDREYRLARSFYGNHNGIVFDDRPDIELHVAFYINAGIWLNPKGIE